jgi:hypothetical protein
MLDQDTKSHQNYELLIRIDEQLKNLTREVRDSNAETTKKLTLIEEVKVLKSEMPSLFTNTDTILKDHEIRI